MSWHNKVVWSEGLFLQPQHFQQSDRYLERLVRGATVPLRPFAWGITEIQVNRDLLSAGKFALTRCRGILADGTPFELPGDSDLPRPLELEGGLRDTRVMLTLPLHRAGSLEVVNGEDTESVARYHVQEVELTDSVGAAAPAQVLVGRLRLRLALESDELSGLSCLGIARIAEVGPNGAVTLDESYLPPALCCSALPPLASFMTELVGLLRQRSEALAARIGGGGARGVAQITDFLLLQTVNRYHPLITHLAAAAEIHPYDLFGLCGSLAGDMATFTARNRQPPAFPTYVHDDLQASFQPLLAELRRSLSAVLEQTAIALPLQQRRAGIWVSPITDRNLLTGSAFVLAVQADMPGEKLRRLLPNHLKIGPVEQIRELITVALPGIAVAPLPVAPRQIPYHADKVYFQLDRSSSFWSKLTNSGGFALHLSGEFPGIGMEFWAIRDEEG